MSRQYIRVRESMGRCLLNGDVFQEFYNRFLQSHIEIAQKFRNTDFAQQKRLLHDGINLAIMFAEGNVVGKNGIERIAETHGKAGLNISPHWYSYWLESFIDAVEVFDPEFSLELEDEWREVLSKAIEYIKARYDKCRPSTGNPALQSSHSRG